METKTEVKYVPGPWRVSGCRRSTSQGTDDYFVEHGDTETYSPTIAEIKSDGGRLPVEANARLISAAPELYEAMQGLFKHCAMIHKHWGDECNARQADAAIARAQAVLAKAEGREL